jgi:hypothetical protein
MTTSLPSHSSTVGDKEAMDILPYIPRREEDQPLERDHSTLAPTITDNHHKRTKYRSMDSAVLDEKFPFWKLPRELRDLVYHHTFGGTSICIKWVRKTQVVPVMADYGRVERLSAGVQEELPSWLQTTKRLKEEALEQFYRKAQFAVHPPQLNTHSAELRAWFNNRDSVANVRRRNKSLMLPLLRRAKKVVVYGWGAECASFNSISATRSVGNVEKLLSVAVLSKSLQG